MFGRHKAVILPTGVDTKKFRPIPQKEARAKLRWDPSEEIVLFNAGKEPEVKRLDLAMLAVAEARRLGAKFQFIVLRGTIPHQDMPFCYNAADVLLLTSDFEGSPTVVQEAIACGLPIVSVEVGDVGERLKSVLPSKIVSRAPSDIATAICEILSLRLRSNGYEVAEREFSNSVLIPQVAGVLRSAANFECNI